jgi:hypothetical protein
LVFVDPTGLDPDPLNLLPQAIQIPTSNGPFGTSSGTPTQLPNAPGLFSPGADAFKPQTLGDQTIGVVSKGKAPAPRIPVLSDVADIPKNLVNGAYFFGKDALHLNTAEDFAPWGGELLEAGEQRQLAWGTFSTALTGGLGGAEAQIPRVFWSGGRDLAGDAAMSFALQNGKKTLEMTLGGRLMEDFGKLLPKSVQKPIWNLLSKSFASGAKDSADVFLRAKGLYPGNIWEKIERDTLTSNGVVINEHLVH